MEQNESIDENVLSEEVQQRIEEVAGEIPENATIVYYNINAVPAEEQTEVEVLTEPPFDFNFISHVGTDGVQTGTFAAMCWNLALLYIGFELIKWVDVKFEKIFRRMGKDD